MSKKEDIIKIKECLWKIYCKLTEASIHKTDLPKDIKNKLENIKCKITPIKETARDNKTLEDMICAEDLCEKFIKGVEDIKAGKPLELKKNKRMSDWIAEVFNFKQQKKRQTIKD